jgi:O-antigen ligase
MQLANTRQGARLNLPALLTGGPIVTVAALLIVLPPLLGAVLVFGAIGGTLVLIYPRLGFYLLLLSIPVQDLGATGELTLTNALFGLTVLAWVLHRATFGGEPLPRSAVGPIFAIFVAGLTLSLIVARELAPGIAALFQWAKALFVYFLALDFLRTRRQVSAALITLLLAGAGEAAIGLVQYTTGIGPASFAIGAQFSRAFGTFGRPNSYAGYLEMILPPAALFGWWLWRNRPAAEAWQRRALRLAALGGAALIGMAVLASFSRGAWLGTSGAIAVMIVLTSKRARTLAVVAAIAGGVFLLAGGGQLLPSSIQDRVGSVLGNSDAPDVRTAFITAENFAIVERLAHWEAGLGMFRSDRLFGVGLGNFNLRYSEFSVSPTFLLSQGHAHNYYIHVAAEAGLIGLCTYLLLLVTLIFTGFRALRETSRAGGDPLARGLTLGAFGTITAVAIHNIFENLHVLSMGIQLSTIWALLTIVAQPGWRATAASSENEAR